MAIQAPYKGESLRASWAADVTAAVNALAPMGGSGLLARQGLGGTGYSALPENKRGRLTEGIKPFLVRHVEENTNSGGDIPYTGWEIYLPAGCVTVGSSCLAINPKAKREKDGEEEELAAWYRLPFPTDEDPEDGDVYEVKVHAKCCAARTGIDTFTDWPKRLLWAEAHKTDRTQQELEEDVGDVGDTFSSLVGTIVFTENDDNEIEHNYLHSIKTPIMVLETATSEPMALFFAFTVNANTLALTLDNIYVKNLTFSAAGATFVSQNMTEIETDDEAVYLKIVTTTTPYTASIESYQAQSSGSGGSDSSGTMSVEEQVREDRNDGEIWLKLYALKNGHVILNNLKSLQNIQIYS